MHPKNSSHRDQLRFPWDDFARSAPSNLSQCLVGLSGSQQTLSIELLTTLDHENQAGQCQLSTGKYWEWIHDNESPSQEEMVKHGTSWIGSVMYLHRCFSFSHAGAAQAHNGTHFLAQVWTWQQTKTSLGPTKRWNDWNKKMDMSIVTSTSATLDPSSWLHGDHNITLLQQLRHSDVDALHRYLCCRFTSFVVSTTIPDGTRFDRDWNHQKMCHLAHALAMPSIWWVCPKISGTRISWLNYIGS